MASCSDVGGHPVEARGGQIVSWFMHRKQKSIFLLFHLLLLAFELRTKYRTHVPSRDFQLYFCQSLAGLSNEGSVDPGDSKSLPPITTLHALGS